MKNSVQLIIAMFFCSALTLSFTKPPKPSQKQNPTYTKAEIAKGKYLVNIMGCADCHAPKMMTPQGPIPDPNLGLSGHPSAIKNGKITKESLAEGWVLFNMSNTTAVGPWGVSYSANLTSDATGIGNWTEQQFIIAMTEGKSKGIRTNRPLLPPMPWPNYIEMKKEDLRAIFAYLKSTKPVSNVVPAPVSPDKM